MTPRPVRVDLRVDRLIIEGVRSDERDRVATAFERELARLIAGRVPAVLARRGRMAALDASEFGLPPGATPEAVGVGIARTVYAGLDRPTRRHVDTSETKGGAP